MILSLSRYAIHEERNLPPQMLSRCLARLCTSGLAADDDALELPSPLLRAAGISDHHHLHQPWQDPSYADLSRGHGHTFEEGTEGKLRMSHNMPVSSISPLARPAMMQTPSFHRKADLLGADSPPSVQGVHHSVLLGAVAQ